MNPDGTEELMYDPSPKQLEFHALTVPNGLFVGSRGTGKSTALRWEAHMRAMAYPNFKYIILRRTYPELQKSHLTFIGREMKKLGGVYLGGDKIAKYPNGSLGFFGHCQAEEDVLNLLSAEFMWMGFDEISTFPWEMFTKLSVSCRVPEDSGLIAMIRACTNPLGVSAQKINRYFVEKNVEPEEDPDYNPDDWTAIKVRLEDAPFVDQKQYIKRFSGLAAHIRKAWLEGDFVLENALFDFYPTKRDLNGIHQPYHVIPTIDVEKLVKNAQIYRVFDMGYFPDPAYCAWIAHLGHRYIVFHEKTWFKTVASDIARDIKEEDRKLGVNKIAITYCDPTIDINTGADVRTIKDTFEMNGIPMECSINNREMYAAFVHQALAEEAEEGVPRLQIYNKGKAGCPYLVQTIPIQQYDPKHPLKLDDNPDDHAVVALAYFLISGASLQKRPSPDDPGGSTPKWMRPKKSTSRSHVLGSEGVRERY